MTTDLRTFVKMLGSKSLIDIGVASLVPIDDWAIMGTSPMKGAAKHEEHSTQAKQIFLCHLTISSANYTRNIKIYREF